MSIATSACVVCHRKKPRTEMVRVEKTERSGHSNGGGMSWGSLNGKGSRNPRYFGSRRHYHRVRKEWWCKSCYQDKLDEPAPWWVWPILYFVLIYLCFGVGVFAEDLIFQNGGQYSELVFGTIIDMSWSSVDWVWHTFWDLFDAGVKWLDDRSTIV